MKTQTPVVHARRTEETPDNASETPYFQTVEYAYAIAQELAGIFAGKRLEAVTQESRPPSPARLNNDVPAQKEA